MSKEKEILFLEQGKAEEQMNKVLSLQEGESSALLEMGKFYLRDLKLDKAEQYLKDAFSFSIKNNTYAFIYATFLVSVNRTREAAVILEKLAADHFEEVKVYSLLAIAYDMDLDT